MMHFRNILLLCLSIMYMVSYAEETEAQRLHIKLKTGENIVGTVVFQNNEVLLIEDLKGNRYQYPLSEIEIKEAATEYTTIPLQNDRQVASVGLTVQVASGASSAYKTNVGGFANVDLLIGHRNILGKQIFIGGGTGLHTMFSPKQTLLSVPLLLRFSLPFLPQKKQSPIVGIDGGYAFALHKNEKFGLFTGIDFGWQFITNKRTILHISLTGQIQQYRKMTCESIGEEEFEYIGIRVLYNYGLKFGIAF